MIHLQHRVFILHMVSFTCVFLFCFLFVCLFVCLFFQDEASNTVMSAMKALDRGSRQARKERTAVSQGVTQ